MRQERGWFSTTHIFWDGYFLNNTVESIINRYPAKFPDEVLVFVIFVNKRFATIYNFTYLCLNCLKQKIPNSKLRINYENKPSTSTETPVHCHSNCSLVIGKRSTISTYQIIAIRLICNLLSICVNKHLNAIKPAVLVVLIR